MSFKDESEQSAQTEPISMSVGTMSVPMGCYPDGGVDSASLTYETCADGAASDIDVSDSGPSGLSVALDRLDGKAYVSR